MIWDFAIKDSEKPDFPDKLEPAELVHSAVYLKFAVVYRLCTLKAPIYCLHFKQ